MGVAALRVGLPDLDHRIGDRIAVAVEHPARDLDPLAVGIARRRIAEAIARVG